MDGSPDQETLLAFVLELRDGCVYRVSLAAAEGAAAQWRTLSPVGLDQSRCIQFRMRLGGEQVDFWSTGYVHLLQETMDGYIATVTWDHYDSRADGYWLQRKEAA